MQQAATQNQEKPSTEDQSDDVLAMQCVLRALCESHPNRPALEQALERAIQDLASGVLIQLKLSQIVRDPDIPERQKRVDRLYEATGHYLLRSD